MRPGESNSPPPWGWALWNQRRLVLRVVLCGFVLTTVVAYLIPNEYRSVARLMPPEPPSGSGMAMMAALAAKGAAMLPGAELMGVKSNGALFVDLLGGETIQNRVIARFDLRNVYGDRYWTDSRDELRRRTTISEDRKSGVITIRVEDRDPSRSADLTRAYVEELDRLVSEVSTSSARRERVFIEQRLKDVKADLDTASSQLSQYASRNMAVDISAQSKAMLEGVGRLQGELIAGQSELQGLEQIYASTNIRVISMRARVAELKRQLAKLNGDVASDGPQSSPVQGPPSIRKLPILGAGWADLYRAVQVQETVYGLLTQQYELAKIQEAKETPVVRVVDPAAIPEKKSFPPRAWFIALGTMLSLTSAAGWVFVNAAWRQKSASDPGKMLVHEVVSTFSTSMCQALAASTRTRRWNLLVSAGHRKRAISAEQPQVDAIANTESEPPPRTVQSR